MKYFNHSVLFLTFALSASAMEFTQVRLSTWSKGETIFGEDFIAANESVVDYLATLPRPTESGFKSLKFNCQAKIRYIRPDLHTIGTNPPVNGSVDIRTVYELKDCTPIQ